MLRLIAYFFLLLGMVLLALDLIRWGGQGSFMATALGSWWASIHRESLLLLQPAVERHLTPALWDPGVQTLLEWPAFAEALALGLFFWLLARAVGRGRRTRRGRR